MIQVGSIRVLDEAEQDLEDGKSFYDSQSGGVGLYFWESMLAEIACVGFALLASVVESAV